MSAYPGNVRWLHYQQQKTPGPDCSSFPGKHCG